MAEPDSEIDEVGDPVCWLHRLCPECGAVPSDGDEGACWRCGDPADESNPADSAGLAR